MELEWGSVTVAGWRPELRTRGRAVPKTLRQEHTEHTRRALIEAATRLFTENGYAETSIDEVAAGARVTRGALYHHFASKQEIFGAVCDAVDATVVDRVRAAAATAGTGRERLG